MRREEKGIWEVLQISLLIWFWAGTKPWPLEFRPLGLLESTCRIPFDKGNIEQDSCWFTQTAPPALDKYAAQKKQQLHKQ
jgi:hypothetical protein